MLRLPTEDLLEAPECCWYRAIEGGCPWIEYTSDILFHVTPFAGLNSTIKAPVYGAEVGYEYRLNKHWDLLQA